MDEFAASSVYHAEIHTTTVPKAVGRTVYDLLYEPGLTGPLARLLAEFDPVELLGTLTYILSGTSGKKDAPTMQLWVFLSVLAGYHIMLRPLSSLLWHYVRRIANIRLIP